jgi:hypothetical protein
MLIKKIKIPSQAAPRLGSQFALGLLVPRLGLGLGLGLVPQLADDESPGRPSSSSSTGRTSRSSSRFPPSRSWSQFAPISPHVRTLIFRSLIREFQSYSIARDLHICISCFFFFFCPLFSWFGSMRNECRKTSCKVLIDRRTSDEYALAMMIWLAVGIR